MHTHRSSERRRGLLGLIVLNAVMLGLLAVVTLQPSADAQVRARADYTMVGGRVAGSLSNVVFVVDTTNQEMIAMAFEPSQRDMIGVGYRNLRADAVTVGAGGPNR